MSKLSLFKSRILCLLLCCVGSTVWGWAQNDGLPSEDEAEKEKTRQECLQKTFKFTATSTPSTCQSNGTITVELGEGSEDFYEFLYQILGVNGSFSYPPQRENVLVGLPPGRHLVNVSGLCKDNSEVKKFVSQVVVVEGNYQVPEVHTVGGKMSASSQYCNTGQYAFRVEKGSGNFVYTITEAPAGFDVPWEFTPTPSGNDMIVPRDLPPGDYKLSVNDGCYEAVRSFTIETLANDNAVPRPWYTGNPSWLFYVDKNANWCDSIAVDLTWGNEVRNRFKLTDYEISLTFAGETPHDWRDITGVGTQLEAYALPAGKTLYDYYSPENPITLHIREKKCPQNNYSFSYHIVLRHPGISQYGCGNENGFYIQYGEWSSICFPVTVRVYKANDELVDTQVIPHDNTSIRTSFLEQGHYKVVIHDKNGNLVYENNNLTITELPQASFDENFIAKNYVYYGCQYHVYSRVYTNNTECGWVKSTISRVSDGKIFDTRGGSRDFWFGNYYTNLLMDYDTLYKMTLSNEDESIIYQTKTFSIPRPNTPTNIYINVDYWNAHKGAVRLFFNYSGVPILLFAEHESLEIYDPQGKLIHQNFGHNQKTWQSEHIATYTRYALKEGEYTAILRRNCGDLVTKFIVKYPYTWRDLGYRQSYDCNGYKMHIQADVRWNDSPDGGAYYRIIDGSQVGYPTGRYNFSTASIVTPGKYTVEIGTTSAGGVLPLDTLVVDIKPQPLQLDETKTTAYACADNQSEQGYIFVKAKYGIEPYRYELWDESNTQRMPIAPIIDSEGVVEFVYGKVGETYTIRIQDACGNNFSQRITINDLTRNSIASTPDNFICYGEQIRLFCLPMQRYEWYNPEGILFSTEQNPVIKKAQRIDGGRYKVVGFPKACGKGTTSYLDLLVEPCWAPVNPNLMHRVGSWKNNVED